MDQTDTFPNIKQHNAEYPRELQLAREVSRLLTAARFPHDRIWIDLRFDYSMTDHSSSTTELIVISGEVHGIAVLKFQGHFAFQDFTEMFNEVLPHEIAHVLHAVKAKETETEISKPHEEEWQDILAMIAPNSTPVAKVKGLFDERPIRLLKGGIATMCECGDDDAFAVWPDLPSNAAKLQEEELTCKACRFPYVRVGREQWPEKVANEYTFLEGVKAVKLHRTHLQR